MSSRAAPRIVRREPPPAALEALAGLPPLQRRVLAGRGIADPAELELPLRDLPPVGGFPACAEAAELLAPLVREGRRILLVGDYDADGATGIALMTRGLRAMGAADVDYIVPNRFTHGYGLCPALMDAIEARAPAAFVTIDNGMSREAAAALERARERDIRTLVVDHHLPREDLPPGAPPAPADCVVNPRTAAGPFRDLPLAAVGVAFYVLLALRAELDRLDWFARRGLARPNLADFLDLVALGTIADLVPLDRANRILVGQGLERIRAGRCAPGIVALLRAGKRDPRRATSRDLAMTAAPRVNAAGRLDDIGVGIECLLADGRERAHQLASQLDAVNRRRRELQEEMQAEAFRALERLPPPDGGAICLYRPDWHEGVVGILASQLKERYGLPAVVFARAAEGGELKGSGRSMAGLHLRDALAGVDRAEPGLLRRFGGHAMAAGATLASAEAFERFRARFDAEVRRLCPDGFGRELETDGALEPEELNFDNAEFAAGGQPWGQQFPAPCFDGEFDVLGRERVGELHARLLLSPAGRPECQVKAMLFFRDRHDFDPAWRRCRLVYRLDPDEYRGRRSCTLIVEHAEAA